MSGLEADLKAMGRIGPVALRLLLIPGIVEGLVSAGVASAVFGMTGGTGALFALSLGWLLKPCDPSIGEGREGERGGGVSRWGGAAHRRINHTSPPSTPPSPFLVISQCTTYQKRNIGTAKAIPSLLVASASFDDIVAIALYTVCITLAVPSASANKAWDIASAPLQLVFGAALGGAGALVCSATHVWRSGRLRIVAVLACTLANMFFMSRFHLSGAGVLASIVLGGAVAAMWGAGVPRCLSTGPNATHATVVEHAVAAAWQWVGAPLLFGIVGTQVKGGRGRRGAGGGVVSAPTMVLIPSPRLPFRSSSPRSTRPACPAPWPSSRPGRPPAYPPRSCLCRAPTSPRAKRCLSPSTGCPRPPSSRRWRRRRWTG